jgi:hypothetical protein
MARISNLKVADSCISGCSLGVYVVKMPDALADLSFLPDWEASLVLLQLHHFPNFDPSHLHFFSGTNASLIQTW